MDHQDPLISRLLHAVSPALWVMTSRHQDKQAGVVVRSLQTCSDDPPLICVAARKGHWIATVIRDSRVFAACLLGANNQVARRRFADDLTESEQGDAFEGIGFHRLRTGAPVLDRCVWALDCEVVRHFDLEAEHELYVGRVIAASGDPHVRDEAMESHPDDPAQ